MKLKALLAFLLYACFTYGQDLSEGLSIINDTDNYPQQDIAKPAYLNTITDPSFGTTIRRITDAGTGGVIVPLHSTVQPWNTDESMMILYDQSNGVHQLLHGKYYYFIRNLDDIQPDDIEELFWDFDEPEILYYLESMTDDFIRYNVVTKSKEILVNLDDIVTDCTGAIDMGVGIQMMSWDSDVLGFRCQNEGAYAYRISTGELTEFPVDDVSWTAPMPAPSGNLFHHRGKVYDASGDLLHTLNQNTTENSSLGKLPNGDDASFTVTFGASPDGGCEGNIVAHNLVTGECFEVISEDDGYPQNSQSSTNISAIAHKNTQGGWLAASMEGYEQDGQSLLDQEIVLVRAEEGNNTICRIAHHRSDRNEFNPWGAPRATISPSGTRVLFASDWSGAEDGQSVDCYVVELPTYELLLTENSPPVYPGDCNMDGQVSADDAIYINLALGRSLLPRPNASTDWIPQFAYDSGDSIQGVDLKYIDADGNGLINTLDLEVITQNFDSTHNDVISIDVETIEIDTSYTYNNIVIGDTTWHEHNYHFETDGVLSPYSTSLIFDYSEYEDISNVYLDTTDISFEVLFIYNDTIDKKIHITIGELSNGPYSVIIICEDMASAIEEINTPSNSIDFRANNDPVLHLNKQIIVNDEGEKFHVEYHTVSYTIPTEKPNPFRLFPTLLNSSDPILIHSNISTKVHIQFIDIQGKIHHQFTQQLQTGNNILPNTSAHLPRGIYFVRISDNNNYFYTYKIIIT